MVRAVAILLTLFPEIFCGTLWDLTATSKNQCSSEKKLFNLKNIFTASRQVCFFFDYHVLTKENLCYIVSLKKFGK